ncbi:hypothetical protein GNI_127500 [Gregarina niphandrodes]|uniref:Uncharacterized protein n=1 Tax=Gregarina niphandrodes TaxID=110365 RepID=A0A023B2C4_GRENI|nr:hypothetical protein GNI_127500 [Gregarina niphandrodes]EZG49269.1 hypothetical protein GNI_127500 [Gregarina niphandrodes]|eukprot:XP_011132053.1 hypothetical protein GNI_127500 [Gregarina niphandrodes]
MDVECLDGGRKGCIARINTDYCAGGGYDHPLEEIEPLRGVGDICGGGGGAGKTKPDGQPPVPVLKVKRLVNPYPVRHHEAEVRCLLDMPRGILCNPACARACVGTCVKSCASDLCDAAVRQTANCMANVCHALQPSLEPPPEPVPVHPLLNLLRGNKPPIIENPRKKHVSLSPAGGLAGLLDELTEAGTSLAGRFIDYCGTWAPAKNIPKHSRRPIQYVRPPIPNPLAQMPPPTYLTGNRLVDKINRFLDQVLVDPETLGGSRSSTPGQNQDPVTVRRDETVEYVKDGPQGSNAPTGTTGIGPIDSINRLLDDYLVPPPSPPGVSQVESTQSGATSSGATPSGATPSGATPSEATPSGASTQVAGHLRVDNSYGQKLKCMLHCRARERCQYGVRNCAGQAWREVFYSPKTGELQTNCNNPEHQLYWGGQKTVWESLFNGTTDADIDYREQFLERFWPEFYNRQMFYCPHCNRNRFTGKQRVHWQEKLREMVQCDAHQMVWDGPQDLVDFDLEQFLPIATRVNGQDEYDPQGCHHGCIPLMDADNCYDQDGPDYNLPDYSRPDFNLPDYNLPDYNLPDYNLPDYSRPDYNRP